MPLQPLTVTLTDGQKIEVLKRFRAKYADDLKEADEQLTEVLTAIAEADYLAPFLGEPLVADLRKRQPEAEALEKRRQFLGKVIDRLDQVLPKQKEVTVPPPAAGGGARGGNVRRY